MLYLSLPTNDLIGRGEAKEFLMQWLRKPSNEPQTTRYRNISLLSIVGHGGMGKTTLLQHVYEDEITKEFDLKMWVCVSNNFDVKKVIADMLESLKKERPRLETLEALQDSLRAEMMSKKVLLVLDDIWENDEEQDKRKLEKLLAPLAYGKIGSRILVTTRMDSVALTIAKQPHDQEWTMEDIGGMYFDALVKKSFFDKFEDGVFGRYYKMHDLIHELTQSVSIHECLSVEDGIKLSSIIPKTLRHLSVKTTNLDIIKKIGQFKYLHSLFLFHCTSNQDICNALIEIFKASRSLRLLYIYAPKDLEIIPEEIENLIHLRYLSIYIRKFTMLPRSLSNLYHLQYIIYNDPGVQSQPKGDDFLPSDINNLSNLCYVKLPENCISSMCGIGKLKSLQELNMFDLRDVSGYRIGELENMNDLCKLGINCLENVKDAEEAYSANLCAKRRITDLTLCWSNTDSRNIDLDENVLDNLQPPKCLRNLNIQRYMGARSAIWMNNVNPISNLEKIFLSRCMEWETLPPFGQLPFLKILTLCNMPKVKWLESKFNGNDTYRAFPLLEVLYISKLEALEDWFEAGVAAEDGCLFPCLIQLDLSDCPKLKELPSLPSKLKRLEIDRIGWTTLNICSNSNPIPLESLKVFHCPNITSLPVADEMARLAALRSDLSRKLSRSGDH
ncbi:hypothetical protein IEQ34_008010 [Dendrobium chrysotoxum]|uniref:NB-ARC domain-containing protein n=1 Tax=Dendrobium chrysotoxum TaxID=161865 RepID=A0AAV7H7E4_DENCH|nr:hypothetical protein IEQ34_008010 [Dendrobium chrysotoxum]